MGTAVPCYSAEEATWHVGESDTAIGGSGTLGSGGGSTSAQWFVRWKRLRINQPGVYTFTEVATYLNVPTNSKCDRIALVICATTASSGGPDATHPGTALLYVVLDTNEHTTSALLTYAISSVLTLTAEAVSGKYLYYAIARHKPATASSVTLGDRRFAAGEGTNVTWLAYSALTDLPQTADGLNAASDSSGYSPIDRLSFTTTNLSVYVSSAGTPIGSGTYMCLPRCDSEYYVKLEGIAPDSSNKGGMDLKDIAANASRTMLGGVLLDYGAKTLGFGPSTTRTTYALGSGEARTNTRNLVFIFRPDTAQVELLDQNMTNCQGPQSTTYDMAVVAHGCKKSGGSRNNPITLTGSVLPEWWDGVNTAGATVRVGRRPIVTIGDSRAAQLYVTGTSGDGQLATRFTLPRHEWRGAISGNAIIHDATSYHTRIPTRYKSDTPGVGDLCEWRDALFIVAMPFINDCGVGPASGQLDAESTSAEADALVTEAIGLISDMVDDILDNGNFVHLVNCPSAHPSHTTVLAIQLYAVAQYNAALRALAAEKLVTFTDAEEVMQSDPDSYFRAPTPDDIHLSQAGQVAVALKIVEDYERGDAPTTTPAGAIASPPPHIAHRIGW